MGTVFLALFLSLLTFSKAKRTAVFLRGCCHNFQIIQIRKDGFFAYPCNSRQQPPFQILVSLKCGIKYASNKSRKLSPVTGYIRLFKVFPNRLGRVISVTLS